MKKSISFALRLGVTGLCFALFTGCIFDSTGAKSSGKNWVGLPLDSLQSAGPGEQLMMFGGSFFVANRDSASPGIAVIDTATGKISAYYSEQLPPSEMALTQDGNIIVMETDYTQGAVSVLNPAAKSLQKSVITFGSNNSVSAADGQVFLFDHTTGVVTGFTGHTPGQNVVFDAQTGSPSNPYDIAISNGLAFIPRYDSKSLLVLDATLLSGGTRDSIDLSQYATDTATHAPRMAWTTAYNGFVFVALQRWNYNYTALDTALVVVINASTKQVISSIPLHFKNPNAAHVVGSTWYIVGTGNYDQSGGVEKIDLALHNNAGILVSAQSLSADVFDFVPTGDHSGYMSYSTDFGYTTKVKKISY